MTSASLRKKRKFIIKLGKALHKFGTPAHRLEAHLQSVSDSLDLDGSFLIVPTALTFVLWPKGDRDNLEYNYGVRVKPGELDLGSLARTDELVDELCSGQRSLDEALERLEEISNKPNIYPHWLNFLAFGISGGAFALLMGSSWADVLSSLGLSLLIYLLVLAADHSRRIAAALEPLAALVAGFGASIISQFEPSINPSLVVLASIIAFIPGLALTVGLAELSARELQSGTARVMDAIMVMFKLYFGGVLGLAVGELCFGQVIPASAVPVPAWTAWIAVLSLSASLVVMFKTRPKDSLWGILSGVIAYTSSTFAAGYFDAALGAFFGAFFVGVYANMYARWLKSPAIIVTLQGMVILVPGSKIYIGLNTAVSGHEMIHVDHIGGQAFLILMSLVAGLIFSNVVVSPRKTL